MIAKIEIYNDNGDLVNKYKVPPCEKWIDYEDGYEIHKYDFRFMYSEFVPKWQKDSEGNEEEGEKWVNLAEELIPVMDEEEGEDNV